MKHFITIVSSLIFLGLSAQMNYENDILPIFDSKCNSCHGINGSAGLNLTTEEAVLASGVVSDGDYLNSILYQRITGEGGYMPPVWSGNEILTVDEVNSVVDWINGLTIEGCTDELACNYNAGSTGDDGTCIYADGIC